MTDTLEPAALPIRRAHDNRYLAGNFAPVEQELTAFDLPVTGEIPAELEGRWLRNGPNPDSPVDAKLHHWFLGKGMVHGVRLRGGKAEWYRNRYVASAHDRANGLAGWILTVVYDATIDSSELHILDAEDITGPEVASISLPQRVPFGFHGNWVPDASVAPD